MFDLYQAQDLGDYRQAELSRKIAAKQLVLSAKDTGFASTDDRISPARRAIAAVTDVLSAVGGALAAVGRRPHRILTLATPLHRPLGCTQRPLSVPTARPRLTRGHVPGLLDRERRCRALLHVVRRRPGRAGARPRGAQGRHGRVRRHHRVDWARRAA